MTARMSGAGGGAASAGCEGASIASSGSSSASSASTPVKDRPAVNPNLWTSQLNPQENEDVLTMWHQWGVEDSVIHDQIAFWNSQFTRCVRCAQKNIRVKEVTAGCRQNGLAYGSNEYTCRTPACGWTASFQWDDACEEDYFYETLHYPVGIEHFPARWILEWAKVRKFPPGVLQTIADRALTGAQLVAIAGGELGAERLAAEFGLDDTMATTLKAIVDDQNPEF